MASVKSTFILTQKKGCVGRALDAVIKHETDAGLNF